MGDDTTEVLLPKNQIILPNPSLGLGSGTARLCAVRHANGRDWWFINKRALNDKFAVFLFDPYGLHGPYVQTIGNTWDGQAVFGEVTVSEEGNKIAYASSNGQIDLYGFDRCSGTFTSYTELGTPPYNTNTVIAKTYDGVAFSPSGRFLYVNTLQKLYQYDLQNLDPIGSRQTVYTLMPFTITNVSQPDTFSQSLSELQLGADGKVYLSIILYSFYPYEINTSHNHYLSVINNPDSLSVLCNFQLDAINLGNARVLSGLPNFPNYALGKIPDSPCDTLNPPTALFQTIDSSVCLGGCVQLVNQTTAQNSSAISYQWLFPGGTPSSSTDTSVSVCYTQAGIYDVTLIATSAFGSDTLTQTNYITVYPTPSAVIFMTNDTLRAVQHFASYQWFLDGVTATLSEDSFCVASLPGLYTLLFTDENGCTAQASYLVTGLNDLSQTFLFTVSPNPASQKVVCSWSTVSSTSNDLVATLELYDALGKKVTTLKPQQPAEARLNVSGYAAGVYMLRLVSVRGSALSRRLVVE